MRATRILALGAVSLAPLVSLAPAQADPAYKADKVVEFSVKDNETNTTEFASAPAECRTPTIKPGTAARSVRSFGELRFRFGQVDEVSHREFRRVRPRRYKILG